MKPNISLSLNQSLPINLGQNSFRIKYGSNYYEFPSNHIAYIYKKEGLYFIVNKSKSKLPLFIDDFNEIFTDFNPHQFFKLNSSTLLSRNSVRLEKIDGKHVAVAFNNAYEDSFLVPKDIETKFRNWVEFR